MLDLGFRRATGASPHGLGLHLAVFTPLFAFLALVSVLVANPSTGPLNLFLTVTWTLYIPVAVIGLIGAMVSKRENLSQFKGIVHNKVIIQVPTVARKDTLPALHRVIMSALEYCPLNLQNYRIDVVVDEGSEGIADLERAYGENPYVRLVIVPAAYRCKNGSRHKARANQYALEVRRADGEARRDVFVYHLDDDTSLGPDTVASIAEFIARDKGKYHLAQGVLTFPFQLSPSLLSRLADSVRPSDDLSRFYYITGLTGAPLAGLHGEHLLLRSSVEDEIGWDFGPKVIVEDAYFGLHFAAKYPGASTFLNSRSYGASPNGLKDLVKQRSRWASGLMGLVFDRTIAPKKKLALAFSVANWTTGLVHHVGLVLLIAYLLGTSDTSPIMKGFVYIWSYKPGIPGMDVRGGP